MLQFIHGICQNYSFSLFGELNGGICALLAYVELRVRFATSLVCGKRARL